MSTYGMNPGYMPQQSYGYTTPQQWYNNPTQQSYGPVEYSPNYTSGALFGYSNNPYGLYGQNPSLVLAETPYARLTGQPTQLSTSAIPNLNTYLQPMFIDMNAFMGNKSGIPMYPSFIGSTSMQNADKPLYQTYQQYQAQNQSQPQPQQYMPQQYPPQQYPPQNFGYQPQPSFMPQPNMAFPQQSFGFAQQSSGYQQQSFGFMAPNMAMPQPNYGFQQQSFGFSQQSYGYQQQNPFCCFG